MPFISVLMSVWLNIGADFIDRRISQLGSARNLVFWTNVIQFFLILPLAGLVHSLAYQSVALCALVGAITAYGRIPWFRALATNQEISQLTPLVRLSSIFVLLGAVFVLGEPFRLPIFFGGCLLVLGAALSLLDTSAVSLRMSLPANKAPLFALLYALCNATVPLLYKYLVSGGEDLFSVYFHLKAFQALFIGLSSAQGTISSLRLATFDACRLIVIARILQTTAALIYLYALSVLELSVAEPIAALGPFFVLLAEKLFYRKQAPLSSRASIGVRWLSCALASLGLLVLVHHK